MESNCQEQGLNTDPANKYPVGLFEFLLDDDLTVYRANDFFYSQTGYIPELFQTKENCNLRRIVHPDDFEPLSNAVFTKNRDEGVGFEAEARVIRPDGSVIWMLFRGNLIAEKDISLMYCVSMNITQRVVLEKKVRISDERLRAALGNTSQFVFEYNPETKNAVNLVEGSDNKLFSRSLYYMPEYLVESGFIHPDSVRDYLDAFAHAAAGVPVNSLILKMTIEGKISWFRMALTRVSGPTEGSFRLVLFISDVTKEIKAEVALKRDLQYRAALLNSAVVYYEINVTRDLIEKKDHERIRRWTDHTPEHYSELISEMTENLIHPDDREQYKKKFKREAILAATAAGIWEIKFEHRQINSRNAMVWVLTSIYLFSDSQEKGDVLGFFFVTDIHEQKMREVTLRQTSERDALTGLYNKGHTEKMIRYFLKTQSRSNRHALLLIDLDNFKQINDTFGHPVGDIVLAEMGKIIRENFRSTDICGKAGGDEFLILMRDIAKTASVEPVVEKLRSSFKKRIKQVDEKLDGTCSAGIAIFPDHGQTFDLYTNADIALYEVKRHGRNGVMLYRPGNVIGPYPHNLPDIR